MKTGRRKGIFNLTTHSTHVFLTIIWRWKSYGKWPRRQWERKPAATHYNNHYFRLAERVLFYAPSHRYDNIHDFCYTSRRALVGISYMHNPIYRMELSTPFVNRVVEHWLEREISLVWKTQRTTNSIYRDQYAVTLNNFTVHTKRICHKNWEEGRTCFI